MATGHFMQDWQHFSSPDSLGIVHFTVEGDGTNYQVGTTQAHADVFNANYENVLIRRISISHVGTVGVVAYLYVYLDNQHYMLLPPRTTAGNPDVLVWDNLSILCKEIGNQRRNWIAMIATGMAGTDDAWLVVEGDCWNVVEREAVNVSVEGYKWPLTKRRV